MKTNLRSTWLPATVLLSSALASVLAGCNRQAPQTERQAVQRAALPAGGLAVQPTVDFTMLLPPGMGLGQVVLAANGTLTLDDRVRLSAPSGLTNMTNVGPSGTTTLGVGAQVGNVTSQEQVHLRNNATVNGNVITSKPVILESGAKIKGTRVENASFTPLKVITWKVKYPDTSLGNVYVGPNGQKTITPGRYGNVTVQPGGRLTLQSGTYYVESVDLEPGTTLWMDGRSGSVIVYARGSIVYRGAIKDAAGPAPDFLCGYLGTQTVFLEQSFTGSFFAPSAKLVLAASGARHAGTFYGKDLEVYPDVIVAQIPMHIDSDNDGLTLTQEVDTYGTDPFRADTDNDGINDGDEVAYWTSRTDGITWNSDVETLQNPNGGRGDGIINLLDPDSDNDGILDGEEIHGWNITVNGVSKRVFSDPAFADADGDNVPDKLEHDGWQQIIHHVVHTIKTDPMSSDTDNDGLKDSFERELGLDPTTAGTLGYMNDLEWWSIMLNIGSWATKPTSAHLDPRRSPTDSAILVYEKDFLADTATEFKVASSMDFSIYIPAERAGSAITLQLDFLGPVDDPNDKFYGVIYGKPQTPGNPDAGHIVASASNPNESNHLSWTISDPSLLTQGDWWFTINQAYDKDAGEQPRTLRIQARYVADNSYVKMIYFCDNPIGNHHTTARYTYTVTGTVPTFFRGETIISNGAGNSFVDNLKVTDFGGTLVRSIGKKAFNGYSFQFPLGTVATYDPIANDLTVLNKVVWDWTFDTGLSSRFMTHIDETADNWSDVQVTYDVAYHTNKYEAWSSGLATAPAVLRRGGQMRVIGSNPTLQTQDATVVIRNLAGSDVTSAFTIGKEAGYEDYAAFDGNNATWRENWMVGIPASAPVGRYTVGMSDSSWSSSTEFYVVFDPYATGLSEAERKAYAYDEDSNGYFFGGNDDSGRDIADPWWAINPALSNPLPNPLPTPSFINLQYPLNPQKRAVNDIAATVINGMTDPHAARDAIRQFAGNYIFGSWYTTGNVLAPQAVDATFTNPTYGINRDMVANGQWPATLPDGECMDFGGVSTALARSAGLPSRMISAWSPFIPNTTTFQPSGGRWNFHVWSETWLAAPPTGSDPWYVYDATDFAGSANGSDASRVDFAAAWDPVRVYTGDTTTNMSRTDITSSY